MSNPSGGLTYHYLAWRYKNTLWRNYRSALSRWLKKWSPKESNIILVGPSGGYNLPTEFLQAFETVQVFDIDPWAKYFFKKSHPSLKKINWSREDILGVNKGIVPKLNTVLSSSPNHAILFCNLLGQLPLILQKNESQMHKGQAMNELEIEKFMGDLAKEIERLDNRSVASFHDLYSRNLNPKKNHIVRDHMTKVLFPKHEKEKLIWNLSPREEHQIECVILGS